MKEKNMNETFDYIIVGAGSAGCAVANRLSENANNNVLLIEAGRSSHPLSRLPASFALLIDNPLANWRYRSEPEENTSNRKIPIPRGKLLGGSSSINGLVFVRGNKLDYDTWAQMGNTGWSYDDVLPFFKKMENYQGSVSKLRGTNGPLKVSEVSFFIYLCSILFSPDSTRYFLPFALPIKVRLVFLASSTPQDVKPERDIKIGIFIFTVLITISLVNLPVV